MKRFMQEYGHVIVTLVVVASLLTCGVAAGDKASGAVLSGVRKVTQKIDINEKSIEVKIDSIIEIMAAKGHPLDSGALEIKDSYSQSVMKDLKENGFDLNKMGAKSWHYDEKNKMLYWSKEDISKANQGTRIPVIRYNSNTGTYTVWTAIVGTANRKDGSGDYNALTEYEKYSPSTSQSSDKQTYENAVEHYEKWK